MSENKNKEQHDKTVNVYEKPKLKKEGKLKDITAILMSHLDIVTSSFASE